MKREGRMGSHDAEGNGLEGLGVEGGGGEPLSDAFELQREAARVGFDWGELSGPLAKLREEIAEVEAAVLAADSPAIVEEVGDLLFSVVNVSRLAGVDPAIALASANRKFLRRFEGVVRLARERGVPMPGAPLAELDLLWDEVKEKEREE